MGLSPAKNRRMPMKAKATMDYKSISYGSGNGGNYSGWLRKLHARPWVRDGSDKRLPNLVGFPRYEMIQRARALCQNNPFAQMLLKKVVENVVQDGFRLTTSSESDNGAYAFLVKTAWNEWVKTANVSGVSWKETQRLLCFGLIREGDVGLLFSKGDKDSGGAVQIIPAPAIREPGNTPDKNAVFDGVEVDDTLRPVAFHVTVGDGSITKRVPAEFFHLLAMRQDALDLRGIPAFNGYWELFDQLDAYAKAVVEQAAEQSKVVYSLETAAGERNTYAQRDEDDDGVKVEVTEAGAFIEPAPGQSLKMQRAEAIALDADKFITAILKIIGPSVGIPVEMLMTSLANYSSSQAALQDAQKAFKTIQDHMVFALERLFRWWLEKAIEEGRLPAAPADFAADFVRPGFVYVNRVESAQADQLEVNLGISSESEILLRRGKDPHEVWRQQQADAADKAEYGLKPMPLSTLVQTPQTPQAQDIGALAAAVSEWNAANGRVA